MIHFSIITLFPNLITAGLSEGVVATAKNRQKFSLDVLNPRDFTSDVHRSVDDRPLGGGDGMVMMIDPLRRALDSLGEKRGHTVYLSAQGKPWTDAKAREWSRKYQNVTLICGRYAGVDQRLINHYVDEEVSIGDYILSGGELAALVVVDSVVRLISGVLGNAASSEHESFAHGLLEGPTFTRPIEHELGSVPGVMVSGNHQKVEAIRAALQRVYTACRRPELPLDPEQLAIAVERVGQLSDGDLSVFGLTRNDLAVIKQRL